jgi:hypothetical protein
MNSGVIRTILIVITALFIFGIGWAIFVALGNGDKTANHSNQNPSQSTTPPSNNQTDKPSNNQPSVPKPAAKSSPKQLTKAPRTQVSQEYYIIEYYEVEASASASASAHSGSGSAYAEAHAW